MLSVLIEHPAQKSTAHGTRESQQGSRSKQVAQKACDKRHSNRIGGAKEHTAQNIDEMLNRRAFGCAHRNRKGRADDSHRHQDAREGKLPYVNMFHFLPPFVSIRLLPYGGRCFLASSHSGTRIPSHVVFCTPREALQDVP